MKYSELCEVYDALSKTTKRLEKINILAKYLKKLSKNKLDNKTIYLLRGRVLPDYDSREFLQIFCKDINFFQSFSCFR